MSILIGFMFFITLVVVVALIYNFDKSRKRVNNSHDSKISKDEEKDVANQDKTTFEENKLVYSTMGEEHSPEKTAFAIELEKAQRKHEQEQHEKQRKETRQVQSNKRKVELSRRERSGSDTGVSNTTYYETAVEPSYTPSSNSCSSDSSSSSSSSSDSSSSFSSCD